MGAPKQKWTSDEEGALKAGLVKHGTGKWRTILSDPEFGSALKSRANVDLKVNIKTKRLIRLIKPTLFLVETLDRTNGYGSRKKAKLALKKTPNQDDDNSTALTIVALATGDDAGQQIDPASPLAVSGEPPSRDFKGLFTSVDKILLEAIASLKRPLGPDVKTIFLFIVEHSNMQPDMKRLVTSRLKHLINVGTIVKIKHRYRISPKVCGCKSTTKDSSTLFGRKQGKFFKPRGECCSKSYSIPSRWRSIDDNGHDGTRSRCKSSGGSRIRNRKS